MFFFYQKGNISFKQKQKNILRVVDEANKVKQAMVGDFKHCVKESTLYVLIAI